MTTPAPTPKPTATPAPSAAPAAQAALVDPPHGGRWQRNPATGALQLIQSTQPSAGRQPAPITESPEE